MNPSTLPVTLGYQSSEKFHNFIINILPGIDHPVRIEQLRHEIWRRTLFVALKSLAVLRVLLDHEQPLYHGTNRLWFLAAIILDVVAISELFFFKESKKN